MNITIHQVGAGGTGSWFARLLAHGIASRYATAAGGQIHPFAMGIHLTWSILDPDTIEIRNQARQLFLGAESIGASKSEYLSRMVHMILTAGESVPGIPRHDRKKYINAYTALVQNRQDIPGLDRITSATPSNRHIIVSCVDNTFTRSMLEETLVNMRTEEEEEKFNNVLWLDMGVTPDNSWVVFASLWKDVVKTKYDELTYPDELLSCAERQERGVSPQTTFANCCAGAHASQVALDYICNPSAFFGAFVMGNGHHVDNLATDRAAWSRLLEDIQK